jgi:hypothetical protein
MGILEGMCRFSGIFPDAVLSGLPTDESEILNYLFWKSRT